MNNRASLDAATDRIYGVFSVQPSDINNPDAEFSQGANLANAAKAAGAQHIVYASVGGAERRSSRSAKARIEKHIQQLELSWTILRPVSFMENLTNPNHPEGIKNDTFAVALKPDARFQLIGVDDVGVFVALAFDRPDEYRGAAIEIAGDELTPPQIAAALSRSAGRDITYSQISIAELRGHSPILADWYHWHNEEGGYQADISALRTIHPGLMTIHTWLERFGRAQLKTML